MMAGKLDRRVLVEYPTAGAQDAYGNASITWTPLFTALASVQDVLLSKRGGAESVINGSLRMSMQPCKVTMRYRPTVTTAMRVTLLDENRVMQIVSKSEIGRKVGLELFCENFTV